MRPPLVRGRSSPSRVPDMQVGHPRGWWRQGDGGELATHADHLQVAVSSLEVEVATGEPVEMSQQRAAYPRTGAFGDKRLDWRVAIIWSTDVRKGDWLVAAIRDFARDVASVIPHGFESYARVFHPIEEGAWRRWSDLAAHNRRVAHPGMQFHLIARPPARRP